MDAELHAAHVARVSAWLSARAGHDLSVVVRTGDNEVPIAAGPFLGMQEHPTSKGVYRALFRDDRRISIDPDEEKYITFGYELQSVDATDERLVLGKVNQVVVMTDLGASAQPSAEDVTWPGSAAVPPPVPAPPTAGVVPPPPPPAPAQVAPTGSQALELQVKAPLYENAMASGFFGPVTVRIDGDTATVTGRRSDEPGIMLTGGVALWVLGGVGLVIGLVVAGQATGDSDMGFAFCLMGGGMLFALMGTALYFIGRSRIMRGGMDTLRFSLRDARGCKAHYDTNLGCLLSLVLTPVIGLIAMLVMGRRVVRIALPNDRATRNRRQVLALRAYSARDGALLDSALRYGAAR